MDGESPKEVDERCTGEEKVEKVANENSQKDEDESQTRLQNAISVALTVNDECQLLNAGLRTLLERNEQEARTVDTLIKVKRDELAKLDQLRELLESSSQRSRQLLALLKCSTCCNAKCEATTNGTDTDQDDIFIITEENGGEPMSTDQDADKTSNNNNGINFLATQEIPLAPKTSDTQLTDPRTSNAAKSVLSVTLVPISYHATERESAALPEGDNDTRARSITNLLPPLPNLQVPPPSIKPSVSPAAPSQMTSASIISSISSTLLTELPDTITSILFQSLSKSGIFQPVAPQTAAKPQQQQLLSHQAAEEDETWTERDPRRRNSTAPPPQPQPTPATTISKISKIPDLSIPPPPLPAPTSAPPPPPPPKSTNPIFAKIQGILSAQSAEAENKTRALLASSAASSAGASNLNRRQPYPLQLDQELSSHPSKLLAMFRDERATTHDLMSRRLLLQRSTRAQSKDAADKDKDSETFAEWSIIDAVNKPQRRNAQLEAANKRRNEAKIASLQRLYQDGDEANSTRLERLVTTRLDLREDMCRLMNYCYCIGGSDAKKTKKKKAKQTNKAKKNTATATASSLAILGFDWTDPAIATMESTVAPAAEATSADDNDLYDDLGDGMVDGIDVNEDAAPGGVIGIDDAANATMLDASDDSSTKENKQQPQPQLHLVKSNEVVAAVKSEKRVDKRESGSSTLKEEATKPKQASSSTSNKKRSSDEHSHSSKSPKDNDQRKEASRSGPSSAHSSSSHHRHAHKAHDSYSHHRSTTHRSSCSPAPSHSSSNNNNNNNSSSNSRHRKRSRSPSAHHHHHRSHHSSSRTSATTRPLAESSRERNGQSQAQHNQQSHQHHKESHRHRDGDNSSHTAGERPLSTDSLKRTKYDKR